MRFFEIILFLFYFFNCYNLLEILAARYKEKSSECGIQKIRNKKIYGGTEAARGEYPWIGQIIYSRRNQSVCAATVIHRKYLLTAAHCISGTALRVYGHPKSVRLGIHDSKDAIKNEINCSRTPMLSSNPGDLCSSAYLQEITIDDLIIHEIYSETISDKHHDIGLIILSRHINYDEFTRPICLPASNFDLEPGTNLYIAGWGKTFYESASSKKMKANIPLMTNTKCMEIYNYVQLNLSDGQICAGGEGGRDTCRGDSGGPLMYQNPNRDQFIIYGITSFGSYRCGQPNFPAIYTRVGYYLDWINNFIYD